MNISIFEEITTEDTLLQLEAEGKKYDGLYVDMENAEERKYVKSKASNIIGMLKTLDRARIDKVKDYKDAVEEQALSMQTRLLGANENFTKLIEEHKETRATKLANEKAMKAQQEAAEQKIIDWDESLTLDKLWEFEAKDREAAAQQAINDAKIRDEQLQAQAASDAVERERKRIEREVADSLAAEAKRMADRGYKAKINGEILTAILKTGITLEQAKAVIKLAANGAAGQMRIMY